MASPWMTSHPIKFLYTGWSIVSNIAELPFWATVLLVPRLRPNPEWTYKQAMLVRLFSRLIYYMWRVEMKTPLSLEPGKDKDRFIVFHPGSPEKYVGVVAQDGEIKPEVMGGTWYPSVPDLGSSTVGDICLHFHGGAFILGEGRQADCSFAAKTLLEHMPGTHIFMPQYRLSSNPGGRFPAALQDAITSLLYLTETLHVPESRLILSGDSAGANISLSMLRYIADNPELGLANPSSASLFSPWLDPGNAFTWGRFEPVTGGERDFITNGFGCWGASTLAPSPETGMTLKHPNICFVGNPFETCTPIFISVGSSEVLFGDITTVYKGLAAIKSNTVELCILDNAPHDVLYLGHFMNFEKEAAYAAKKSAQFVQKHRRRLASGSA